MLAKISYLIPSFARQFTEKKEKSVTRTYTHQEWVTIDRIVICVLFLVAIIGAIIFT